MRKRIARLLCIAIVFCMVAVWLIPSQKVSAAGSTLEIYVAYFGQSYAEPVLKATFSKSQLEALGAHSAHYTSVDKGGFSACADVYGVDLSEVLDAAGVNYWSASSLNFRTSDHTAGYTTLSVSYLFGTRYVFPELPLYYGKPEGENARRFADPSDPNVTEVEVIDMLWSSAYSVPTMLAFSENYRRAEDFTVFDGGELSSDQAFRLFIGQTKPNEAVSSNLAAYVESIVVLFPGPPVLSTDESELSLEIGQDYKVRVNVGNTDSDLMADVLSKLKWESDNSSIVSVDQDGQLTVRGNGTATITVYAEGYYDGNGNKVSLSITINAGNGENLGDGGDGTGSGTGSGSGSGAGEGSGTGTGTGDADDEESDDSGSGTGGEAQKPDNNGSTGATKPAETPSDEETESGNGSSDEPTEPEDEPVQKPDESASDDPEEPDDPASDAPEESDEELYVSENQSSTDIQTAQKPAQAQSQGLKVSKLILEGSQTQDSASDGAGSSGYEGGSEAILMVQENPLMIFTIVMSIVFFLCGGAWKYLIFKREI